MLERERKAYWDKTSASTASSEISGAAPEASVASPSPTAISPSASQWTPIGPQATLSGSSHFSGRVTALAVDPNIPTTVYLGAAQGGVWKSIDSGASWTPLTDSQPSLATGSMAVDASGTIFVGTGEENFGSDSYYGAGVLRSTDGGSTWVQLGQNTFAPTTPECTAARLTCGGAKIGAIAVQPGTSGTSAHLLAAVQRGFSNSGGLYWSTDGGTTWVLVSGASGVTADSVVFAGSATAFVGIHTQGVFKCTGFNATPSCVASNGTTNVITVSGTDRVSLATEAAGTTVYTALAVASTSALSGLYKSTDAGANWTKLTVLDFCNGQCFYDMLIAVNPTDPTNVFVGGNGFPNNNFLFHSFDGGTTWIADTNNIHADQHSAAFTPNGGKMYIGNDGGVYSTDTPKSTGTVTWTELNTTLNITQFYGYFTIHPTDPQVTFGGTQDNGTQRFSGNLAWDEVTCGDGAGAVIDPNTPTTVFANCQDVDIRRSANGSPGSFSPQNNAGATISNSGDRVAFIPALVGDTSNPMKLYFGTFRLWQGNTSTTPPTWTAITGDLTAGASATITNIGISPDNSTAYVVTSDGQVSKVANLATTHDVTPSNTLGAAGFPSSTQINAVTVVDANTVFIAVPGFTAGAHIFKTADGGANWANITGNLPNTPVNDLVVDPDLANTLYAATDVGVFISTNNGATWSTLQTGLPRVAVFGLKLHRPSRTLRAATHGRGMWDLSVPACSAGPCITLSPTSLNFNPQVVGTTSGTQTITIKNSGNQTLNISGLSATGEFSQTSNCTSLAANASCSVSVSFSPRGAFARSGNLWISSNAGNPQHASLSGTSLIIPANDDYANAAVITSIPYTSNVITNGATSQGTDPIPAIPSCVDTDFDTTAGFNHHAVWYFYTPASAGTVNLDTIGSDYDTVISVWTGSPGSFATVSCNDDIDPGLVRQSTIQGLSVSAGTTYRILVSGYYAADNGNLTFNLTGPAPSITLSPAALSFSAIMGRQSAAQAVTVTNGTNSPLSISNITVTGDYSLSQNCTGGAILVSGSCVINVVFTPTALGQRNGLLTITDVVSGSPQLMPITGAAFNFSLSLTRFSRPSRSGGGSVIAGQSRSFDLALSTAGFNSGEVVQLECADIPPGAKCSVFPSEVTLGTTSTPISVTMQTSAVNPSGSSQMARRLRGKGQTPVGVYNFRVNARAGTIVSSADLQIEVTADSKRLRALERVSR
jgi:hypothetical protein